jgi:hypothetical protein
MVHLSRGDSSERLSCQSLVRESLDTVRIQLQYGLLWWLGSRRSRARSAERIPTELALHQGSKAKLRAYAKRRMVAPMPSFPKPFLRTFCEPRFVQIADNPLHRSPEHDTTIRRYQEIGSQPKAVPSLSRYCPELPRRSVGLAPGYKSLRSCDWHRVFAASLSRHAYFPMRWYVVKIWAMSFQLLMALLSHLSSSRPAQPP